MFFSDFGCLHSYLATFVFILYELSTVHCFRIYQCFFQKFCISYRLIHWSSWRKRKALLYVTEYITLFIKKAKKKEDVWVGTHEWHVCRTTKAMANFRSQVSSSEQTRYQRTITLCTVKESFCNYTSSY